jgi:hypothetical protein
MSSRPIKGSSRLSRARAVSSVVKFSRTPFFFRPPFSFSRSPCCSSHFPGEETGPPDVLFLLEGVEIRNRLQEVETLEPGLPQIVGAVTLLVVIDRYQEITQIHLALLGGLGVEDRLLDHLLETDGLDRFFVFHRRNVFFHVCFEIAAYLIDIGFALLHDRENGIEEERGVEYVFGSQVLVFFLFRLLIGGVQNGLNVFVYSHRSALSIVHRSGNSFSLAISWTWLTLVTAIS